MKNHLKFIGVSLVLIALSHSALADSRVFIDGDFLYGVSEDSVFKSDLLTGEREIKYRNGRTVQWQDSSADPSRGHIGNRIGLQFMMVGAPKVDGSYSTEAARDGGAFTQGSCTSEANTLKAAVDLVQTACGGGEDTASCSSARTAYDEAQAAYKSCIQRNFEKIK